MSLLHEKEAWFFFFIDEENGANGAVPIDDDSGRYFDPTYWDPEGGDGDGAFIAPFFDYIWYAGAYVRDLVRRNGSVAGGSITGAFYRGQFEDTEAIEVGSITATFDNTSPYTGSCTASIEDGVAAGLFLGPLYPGGTTFDYNFNFDSPNGEFLQDDGDGAIVPAAGQTLTGSGSIDYINGSIEVSYSGTWSDNPGGRIDTLTHYPHVLSYRAEVGGGLIETAPTLPPSITIRWRRPDGPTSSPVTLRLLWDFANDDVEVELPDSEGQASGEYELEIPPGTFRLGMFFVGTGGCTPETLHIWFVPSEIAAALPVAVTSVGIASSIQELLVD